MGADSNQAGSKPRKPRSSATGGTNPFRSRQTPRSKPLVEDVPGILGAVDAVLARGMALMLSLTSDGGAVSIQVLDNGQRYKSYASTQEELNEVFADLYDAYSDKEPQP